MRMLDGKTLEDFECKMEKLEFTGFRHPTESFKYQCQCHNIDVQLQTWPTANTSSIRKQLTSVLPVFVTKNNHNISTGNITVTSRPPQITIHKTPSLRWCISPHFPWVYFVDGLFFLIASSFQFVSCTLHYLLHDISTGDPPPTPNKKKKKKRNTV